jgi:hypothetical protein
MAASGATCRFQFLADAEFRKSLASAMGETLTTVIYRVHPAMYIPYGSS